MGKLDWYKRNPAKFIGGTVGMTFEQKGAYAIVLDLIYDHDGEIDDNSGWIAGVLALQPRRWDRIRDALIARGKLYRAQNGKLRNGKADEELKRSSSDDKTQTVLDKTKTIPRKTQNVLDKTQNDLDLGGSDSNSSNDLTPETRARESQNKKQNKKQIDSAFEEFWKQYPRKIGKDGAKTKYAAIVRAGRATAEELLDGVKRFADAATGTETQYIKHPATWLHNGCWADELGVPVAVIQTPAAEIDWKTAMRHLLAYGHWMPDAYGPTPFEEGCRAPAEMLAKASDWWERNDRTPTNPMTRTAWVPKPFWGANVVPLRSAG